MIDPYPADALTSQATNWQLLTPSDTDDLAVIPKAIIVIDGGDVVLVGLNAPASDNSGVKWEGVQAWTQLPVRPRRILATGTTATKIMGLF